MSMGETVFYLPEDSNYSIFDSVNDSIRFTVERTLVPYKGHLCSKSTFVDPEGEIMGWHDFGNLEGPGWAANAVGGAYEIYKFGRLTNDKRYQNVALSILDHVLEDGFIDHESGFIIGYRDVQQQDAFCLNYRHNNDWFCPGSMAKIGYQLLTFSDLVPDGQRRERMRKIAVRTAWWIDKNVVMAPNGWYPRRSQADGKTYEFNAYGDKPDQIFDISGDGLFIIHLMTELTQRGYADHRSRIREKVDIFVNRGGFFGSINHDTYDAHENVAYAVAFRVLHQAANLLRNEHVRQFAYNVCLSRLDKFKMSEDRNGVATRGLLFMEESWDTAYLWENAEAALAYIEAYGETREEQYLSDGLTILRAIARHHHDKYGFLTEGVDWNNHVGKQHHFEGAEFGDIQYTEPFLNNQHITEPTLEYLEKYAVKKTEGEKTEYYDFERNRICII